MTEDIEQIARGDRPSRHGRILGDALADLAEAGQVADHCATCAFRRGSLANMSAGTGMIALNCVLGVDPDDFACHHRMSGGQPTRPCAGYHAALSIGFIAVRSRVMQIGGELDRQSGDDPERAAFDEWVNRTDPDGQMDVYQLGRAWARSSHLQQKEQPDE